MFDVIFSIIWLSLFMVLCGLYLLLIILPIIQRIWHSSKSSHMATDLPNPIEHVLEKAYDLIKCYKFCKTLFMALGKPP